MVSSEFRRLPSVDKVMADERILRFEVAYPHDLLVGIVRKRLDQARAKIAAGRPAASLDDIVNEVSVQVWALAKPSLRPVINATGVILHTNLGRAPLSLEAIAAMDVVSRDYSNLEFDLDTGTRGSRSVHIESILRQLTGAEAAIVVNNNASAVLLGLTALAKRKEVIISRSEAVEIGGGFRIPDVMRQSGAKLVEVGTTNCTYATDYEEAITPHTAALLRVHSSNFRITGFTHSVTLEEMSEVAKKHGLPLFDDLGSGCFLDTAAYGLDPEPMVQQSVAVGAGLVFFSGDKLVGGPQAGIIVGKKEFIDNLRKHPMMRAMRVDKIRIAALNATLVHYLKGEATTKIPIWRMIATPVTEIEKRARAWAEAIGDIAQVIDGESMVGGGSLPGSTLPTRLVAIRKGDRKGLGIVVLARKLRQLECPIIGRISEDELLLDPRSVLPEEDSMVLDELRNIASTLK